MAGPLLGIYLISLAHVGVNIAYIFLGEDRKRFIEKNRFVTVYLLSLVLTILVFVLLLLIIIHPIDNFGSISAFFYILLLLFFLAQVMFHALSFTLFIRKVADSNKGIMVVA
jgi:hypothetical protein